MHEVRLRKGAHRRVAGGHAWVFSNELERLDPAIPAGEDVVVRDARGRLLGTGTYNPKSLIAVRLHARRAALALDASLIAERIGYAARCRKRWLGEEASLACRYVNSEGDGLPGLVVDRYGDYLSIQCLTAAMDRRTDAVLEACQDLFSPKGIVLRNDTPYRDLEGLPRSVTVVRGRVPDLVPFTVAGFRVRADLLKGQKTGFFFDQRENYRLLAPLCAGKKVLDGFCYTGIWGMHAARAGADEVVCVDTSPEALALAEHNSRLNGLTGMRFERSDMVDFLRGQAAQGQCFDVIVLDPPPYARTARAVEEALKGYVNLNKWALRCLAAGDAYLLTGSCSHHVSPERFIHALSIAGRLSGRRLRVLQQAGQAMDHPWVPAMPETAYLKMILLHVH
jgi:23S rRNA (cytosine1962-C5)-methyltransferase